MTSETGGLSWNLQRPSLRQRGFSGSFSTPTIVTDKSLDSPEKGMSTKCPKNEEMSEKCPEIVQELSRVAENTIFGHFFTIFRYLVDEKEESLKANIVTKDCFEVLQ